MPERERAVRPCPWCGEEIRRSAIVCRFCHNDVTPRGEERARRFAAGEEPAAAVQPLALPEGSGLARLAKYVPQGLLEGIVAGADALEEGERRPIAVLFADLSRFTALTEEIGAEAVSDLLRALHGRVREVVARYGGIVEKWIGDAVMALFGAPVSHGDDPERAIRAALEIRRQVKEEGTARDLDLDIHSGVAFGEVIFRRFGGRSDIDHQTIGDAVNLAARLQSLAGPGETLVDHRIHLQTRTTFEWEHRPAVTIRGRSRPVAVHRVTGIRKQFSKVSLGERIEMVPLVGRREELDLLVKSAERLRAGRGCVVHVRGEAGVGKSRLVYELYHHLPAGKIHWFTGRCLSFGAGIPFLPFAELLRAVLRLPRAEEAAITDALLRHAVRDHCARRGRSGSARASEQRDRILHAAAVLLSVDIGENPLLRLSPQERRRAIFAAVSDLLALVSLAQPTVLVFEDFHWADPDSLDLLDHLILALHGRRVMLVILSRPEMIHELPAVENVHRLSIEELPAAESELLLSRLLHIEHLPRALRERILEKTEGNPFYIEEVVLELEAQGVLRRRARGYRLAAPVEAIQIPDTVEGVVLARLDRLERTLRSVLQCASVIGQEFRYRMLAHVTEIGEQLQTRIAALVHGDFVLQRTLIPELVYAFRHIVLRDVAYQTLLEKRRRHFHARVAEVLEMLFADRLDEFVELIAHHCERGGVADKAITYLERAALKCENLCANRAALDCWQRLLRVIDTAASPLRDAGPIRLRANLHIAELCRRLGLPEHALAACQLALCEAKEQRDTASAVAALHWMSEAHRLLGQPDEAWRAADEALRRARSTRDSALVARCHNLRGHLARARGDLAGARRDFRQVLRFAERTGDRMRRLQALNHLAILHIYSGESEKAERNLEEALALARELANPREAVMITINLGFNALRRGDPAKAQRLIAQALAQAEKVEFERGAQLALVALSDVHLKAGDFRRAEAVARRLIRRTAEARFADALAVAHSNHARAALALGRVDEAERDIEVCLMRASADGNWVGQIDGLAVQAEVLLARGEAKAALKTCRAMSAMIDEHRENEPLAMTQTLCARAHLALRQISAARKMAQAATETARRAKNPRDEGWALLAQAQCEKSARDGAGFKKLADASRRLGEQVGDAALVAAASELLH
jgi:class 3 adenylate cyclase/tetratricopeptide (TPR) repeat protein